MQLNYSSHYLLSKSVSPLFPVAVTMLLSQHPRGIVQSRVLAVADGRRLLLHESVWAVLAAVQDGR